MPVANLPSKDIDKVLLKMTIGFPMLCMLTEFFNYGHYYKFFLNELTGTSFEYFFCFLPRFSCVFFCPESIVFSAFWLLFCLFALRLLFLARRWRVFVSPSIFANTTTLKGRRDTHDVLKKQLNQNIRPFCGGLHCTPSVDSQITFTQCHYSKISPNLYAYSSSVDPTVLTTLHLGYWSLWRKRLVYASKKS